MDLAHKLVGRVVRNLRKRKAFEIEPDGQGGDFARAWRGQPSHRVTHSYQSNGSQAGNIFVHAALTLSGNSLSYWSHGAGHASRTLRPNSRSHSTGWARFQ